NWGDGSPDEAFALAAGARDFTVTHRFLREAPGVTVQVTLRDKDGGVAQGSTIVFTNGYITGLYHDVLFRTPDPTGFAFWTDALNRGLLTRFQIATQFLVSPERRGLVVDEFYRQVLHREADAAGRALWVAALLRGVSEADVVVVFVTSPEYTAAHPDNRGYALGLYQDLLLRPPGGVSAQELDFQQRALDFRVVTRGQMALAFLASDEAYVKAITQYFEAYLHRAPDPSGFNFFLGALRRGFLSANDLQAVLLASDEYFRRVTT